MAKEAPIADTDVMDMSANCFVPVEGLRSRISNVTNSNKNFLKLMKTGVT